MDVKTAIETSDAAALRRLLTDLPARADELIPWGKDCHIATHPLHYISDMLFENTLQKGKELPFAGSADSGRGGCRFPAERRGRHAAYRRGEPGSGRSGLRLLVAGAKPGLRGLFGETALHWAALLGEDRLAGRLIENVDPNLKDEKYKSSSLGWAVHGWCDPPAGNHGCQLEVVRLLVAAGATVEPEWMESEKIASSPAMLAALRATDS
jgi:uncharacterized protein